MMVYYSNEGDWIYWWQDCICWASKNYDYGTSYWIVPGTHDELED